MADAIIVGGASFNTLNKWALGVSDTLALGLMTEGIGLVRQPHFVTFAAFPLVKAVYLLKS